MDFSSIDTFINIASLLGGGGIGGFLTWKYTRRTKEAEAEQAETTAAKEVQDVYQQLINDVKADREEQKAYISELKEDRRHLRMERDELRNRIDKTDETVRDLQAKVAQNSREVELMRPFVCGVIGCKLRRPVAVSEKEERKPKPKRTPTKKLP